MENNFDPQGYLDMELLRFTTAGSVDDGKSTLIGRLLFDSKSIFEDQVQQIEQTSKNKGLGHVDLSLFTDGLKDEREQGITIDVAYSAQHHVGNLSSRIRQVTSNTPETW